MPVKKGTLLICKEGHRYFKNSDCNTCPVCEKQRNPVDGFLSLLPAPARRALENKDIKTLKQLSRFTEKEIQTLHGMGKTSIPILRRALQNEKLTFKK